MKRISLLLTLGCIVFSCVPKIPVEGIQLEETTLELEVGDSRSLIFYIFPSDATNQEVAWSSSNTAVATVTDGTVRAISPGTASISVRTLENNLTVSCQVTVIKKRVPIQSVSFDMSEVNVRMGDSVMLNIIIRPEEAIRNEIRVTWYSGDAGNYIVAEGTVIADTRFAAVNGTDLKASVVGKRFGTASITALVQDKAFPTSDTLHVSVNILCKEPEPIDLGLSVYWGSFDLALNGINDDGLRYPADYDGLFAWGITNWERYDFGHTSTPYPYKNKTGDGWTTPYEIVYTDIGSNICGTQYDVAHMQLGGGWRMPTKEEFQELIDSCEKEKVMLDKMPFFRLTGPNGQAIYLPKGNLWSGNVCESVAPESWMSPDQLAPFSQAYYLNVGEDGLALGLTLREAGFRIRPVKNK